MKKSVFILIIALLGVLPALTAQKYLTRDGKVSFFSDAPLEKIEAHNSKATSVMDATTGKMEFAILIKAFQFEKALMQEHFNENYMESDKYPKSVLKAQIENMDEVDLAKDGTYPVRLKGALTIHGETNEVETEGNIVVQDGNISATSSFEIAVADYKIEIPKVVRENIAKNVRIDVEVNYQELNK